MAEFSQNNKKVQKTKKQTQNKICDSTIEKNRNLIPEVGKV